MADQILRRRAAGALDVLYDLARHDGATYATADGPRHLADTHAALHRHLQAAEYWNPDYSCFGEMAASLVLLAAEDPDTYATIIGPAARDSAKVEPATLEGLVFLFNVVHVLNDDHNYALDLSGPLPVIRLDDAQVPGLTGISPRRLLEALEPLVDALPKAPLP